MDHTTEDSSVPSRELLPPLLNAAPHAVHKADRPEVPVALRLSEMDANTIQQACRTLFGVDSDELEESVYYMVAGGTDLQRAFQVIAYYEDVEIPPGLDDLLGDIARRVRPERYGRRRSKLRRALPVALDVLHAVVVRICGRDVTLADRRSTTPPRTAGGAFPEGAPPVAPEHPNRTEHPNQNRTGGVS